MTKTEAGRLGGLATFKKHGKIHMQKNGRKGAAVTWSRYFLAPVGQSHYAMVRRSDNVIISTNMSLPWRM